MHKTYTLFKFALLSNILLAQTDQSNLEKYWKYRHRLTKDFLHAGNDQGNSIPISARRIGFPNYGLTPTDEVPSSFYWQDATIYLSHYIEVLATEYKLLVGSGAIQSRL